MQDLGIPLPYWSMQVYSIASLWDCYLFPSIISSPTHC